jgi:hypothetical protein
MNEPTPPRPADINTPEGLLRHLLYVNECGVAFVRVDDDKYHQLPRWLWGHCKRALGVKS